MPAPKPDPLWHVQLLGEKTAAIRDREGKSIGCVEAEHAPVITAAIALRDAATKVLESATFSPFREGLLVSSEAIAGLRRALEFAGRPVADEGVLFDDVVSVGPPTDAPPIVVDVEAALAAQIEDDRPWIEAAVRDLSRACPKCGALAGAPCYPKNHLPDPAPVPEHRACVQYKCRASSRGECKAPGDPLWCPDRIRPTVAGMDLAQAVDLGRPGGDLTARVVVEKKPEGFRVVSVETSENPCSLCPDPGPKCETCASRPTEPCPFCGMPVADADAVDPPADVCSHEGSAP